MIDCTLGFRTRRGGVETVVSADAAVMLTERGRWRFGLLSVQAGALPLPVMQVAEDVSQACQKLSLPVTLDAGRRPAGGDVDVNRVGKSGQGDLAQCGGASRGYNLYRGADANGGR